MLIDDGSPLCDPLIRRKEDEESCKAGTLQERLSPDLVKISELSSASVIGRSAAWHEDQISSHRLPTGITDFLEATSPRRRQAHLA